MAMMTVTAFQGFCIWWKPLNKTGANKVKGSDTQKEGRTGGYKIIKV